MVALKANLLFDYRKADLYAGYESATFLADSLKPSSMFYVYTSDVTAITVTGKNFSYTGSDIPVAGTTQSATLFILSPQGDYIPAYSLSKFSISIGEAFQFIQQKPSEVLADIFSGKDEIKGSKFADHINGFAGKDELTGDKGADTFYFTYKEVASKFDKITDFKHNEDQIALKGSIFKGISSANLEDTFHDISEDAVERNDRLLYDSSTGELSYDKDGSGRAPDVTIAFLTDAKGKHPTLDETDFLII